MEVPDSNDPLGQPEGQDNDSPIPTLKGKLSGALQGVGVGDPTKRLRMVLLLSYKAGSFDINI